MGARGADGPPATRHAGRAGRARRRLDGVPLLGPLVRVVTETVGLCVRYRVTGLAAEAGFFALLSLPALVLGLAGTAAWVGSRLGADTTTQLRELVREQLSPVLTAQVVESTILPTLTEALSGPRFDLISIGFLVSLWSGSRALSVLLDTITIMYGHGGRRGIVRTRALSVALYAVGLAAGAVTLPLLLLGPGLIGSLLPSSLDWLVGAYWPVLLLLSSALLASLYHVAVPVQARWRAAVPGALLALALWVLASWGMRALVGGGGGDPERVTSVYGPLGTPIVLLLWLFLLAVAVLVGAGLNAALDHVLNRRDGQEPVLPQRVVGRG